MNQHLRVDALIEVAISETVPALGVLESVVAQVLLNEGVSGDWELGIRITDDAELHELNRTYRGVDAPTDVLSFGDDDAESEFVTPEELDGGPQYLGDLALSYERVIAQAAEYGHSTRRELCYLVAHGTLHLLGYDHETEEERQEMRVREEAALEALGLTREAEPPA